MTAKKREYKKRNVITVRMHRDMYNIISKVFVLSVILATISFGLLGLACYRMYYTQLALEQIDARYSTTKTSELLSLTQEIVVKQQQDSNLLKAVASNNEQENKQLKEERPLICIFHTICLGIEIRLNQTLYRIFSYMVTIS